MTGNRECSLGSMGAMGLAFVTGGLLGAAAALLLAPQSGRQSREQLRGHARRAEERVHELADKATESVDQALDKGCEFIQGKKSREHERLSGEKKA
jgi:gas vesicle protein